MTSPGEPSRPGANWRIAAKDGTNEIELQDRGIFDELVIDDGFHLEQMDDPSRWVRIGDAHVHVVVRGPGDVTVTIERDVS
jgi:hypothetical protein